MAANRTGSGMTGPSNNSAWKPEDEFPTDPEFYQRVLRYLPTPVIVVEESGEIIYANDALFALGGWEPEQDTNRNIINYIHPDDRDTLALAFIALVEDPSSRILGSGPWAEISFRILCADGSSLPIQLVGTGGLLDSAVGGIIYEIRPGRERNLLGRVLEGLSSGAPMHQLLSLACEMVIGPPLELDCAILQSDPKHDLLLAASTNAELSEILHTSALDAPWRSLQKEPTAVAIDRLPQATKERIHRAGFKDMWFVSVESPLTSTTLRIVAVSPTVQVPASGSLQRLVHARELTAAVLLRTQTDVLLDHAADHDRLTQLPNRAAFYQLADAIDPMTERGALHLDLDGLKTLNQDMGWTTGDAVLQVIADRIRVECDTDDIVGRIGDDEFAIVLCSAPDGSMQARTVALASSLQSIISEPVIVAGRAVEMSASIGVATAQRGTGTDQLLTWADAAMHDAKQSGGGAIRRFGIAFS